MFTKNKGRIQKLKETGDTRYIYQIMTYTKIQPEEQVVTRYSVLVIYCVMDINDDSPQLLTNVLNKKYRDTTTDIRTRIISEGHQMVYYSCRHERFNRESDSYCVLWTFPGTYAWFVLLNSKKCITISNAFQKKKKKRMNLAINQVKYS